MQNEYNSKQHCNNFPKIGLSENLYGHINRHFNSQRDLSNCKLYEKTHCLMVNLLLMWRIWRGKKHCGRVNVRKYLTRALHWKQSYFWFLALAKGTYVVNLACVCVHLWHLLRYTVTQEGKVGLKSHLVYRCAIVRRCALLFSVSARVTQGQIWSKIAKSLKSNFQWQGPTHLIFCDK